MTPVCVAQGEGSISTSRPARPPPPPSVYLRSAPIRRLQHPLEESVIWGAGSAVLGAAISVAVGVLVMGALCLVLPLCMLGRYLTAVASWARAGRGSNSGESGIKAEVVRGNDARWLDDAAQRSVLHAVLVFESGLDVEQLRHLMFTRVVGATNSEGDLVYPRLTERIVPYPAGYYWVRDPCFHVEHHVFRGPPVTTEPQLQEYLARLLADGIPFDKPPWELHVLPAYGKHHDTVAVLRMHQSVADGMSLVRILCHSLADTRVLHIPQKPHFGGLTFSLNVFRACLVGPLTLLVWLLFTWDDCNILTHRAAWTGSHSVTWSAAITLPKVSRIKQVTRSSINDVLLSALTGGVRKFLQSCGVRQPRNIKVVVPVDLRNDITSPKPVSPLGSKISPVVVTMPAAVEGAIPRLWATRRHMDDLKTSADAVVLYGATAILMNILPQRWARYLLAKLGSKASLQFGSVPGPASMLLVGGHPLKGVYPLFPAQKNVGVAVSVFTYADQVYVTVTTDRALGPAGRMLLHNFHCQIEILSQLLMNRRVPGEQRPSVVFRRDEFTRPPVEELQLKLRYVQDEVHRLTQILRDAASPTTSKGTKEKLTEAQREDLQSKLQSLKAEFTQLLSEMRRRRSLVEGSSVLFEDEEAEGEMWRPRKRHIGSASSRRTSPLVGLLTSRQSVTSPLSPEPSSPSSDLTSPILKEAFSFNRVTSMSSGGCGQELDTTSSVSSPVQEDPVVSLRSPPFGNPGKRSIAGTSVGNCRVMDEAAYVNMVECAPFAVPESSGSSDDKSTSGDGTHIVTEDTIAIPVAHISGLPSPSTVEGSKMSIPAKVAVKNSVAVTTDKTSSPSSTNSPIGSTDSSAINPPIDTSPSPGSSRNLSLPKVLSNGINRAMIPGLVNEKIHSITTGANQSTATPHDVNPSMSRNPTRTCSTRNELTTQCSSPTRRGEDASPTSPPVPESAFAVGKRVGSRIKAITKRLLSGPSTSAVSPEIETFSFTPPSSMSTKIISVPKSEKREFDEGVCGSKQRQTQFMVVKASNTPNKVDVSIERAHIDNGPGTKSTNTTHERLDAASAASGLPEPCLTASGSRPLRPTTLAGVNPR